MPIVTPDRSLTLQTAAALSPNDTCESSHSPENVPCPMVELPLCIITLVTHALSSRKAPFCWSHLSHTGQCTGLSMTLVCAWCAKGLQADVSFSSPTHIINTLLTSQLGNFVLWMNAMLDTSHILLHV